MSKSQIVVLSDIHIGTNAPTVWYQQKYHEPYLATVLDYVIKNASEIKELILLGDVVDFWTYPPDELPPSFDAIMAANPNIFGLNGKLSEVLTALKGNVTYVRGNHDMTITQNDLDKIENPEGYKIKLSLDDIYYPLDNGNGDKRIACTHAHLYTMFNAPYTNNNPVAPLPLGHFITRCVAFKRSNELKGSDKTVAELAGSGDPSNDELLPNLFDELLKSNINQFSLAETVLRIVANATGVKETQLIKLAADKEITFGNAVKIYNALFSEWVSQHGELVACKSVMADKDGSYLGWFAQKLALPQNTELVVMGHTHKPISGLSESLIQYINTGFGCPSTLDIGKKHPTFVMIDVDKCQGKVYQVVKDEKSYDIIKLDSAEKAKVCSDLSLGDSFWNLSGKDYSCYVIIDNRQGKFDLTRKDYGKNHGDYPVAPPDRIKRGEQVKFWLQDLPGLIGSEGWVAYQQDGGNEIKFTYQCPYRYKFNSCSEGEANFYTKSGSSDWGGENEVAKLGFPFFVRFVL